MPRNWTKSIPGACGGTQGDGWPSSAPGTESREHWCLLERPLEFPDVARPGAAPQQLDVVEADAIAQGVVGEVQDVVGLMVGGVEFEEMEPLVDGLGETEFPHEQLDGADAAAGDGPG